MVVNFIVIGAQKSGTTTLASILGAHPQVSFCKIKEPHFFSKNDNWRTDLEKYHAMFPPKPMSSIRGEASTSYTFFPVYPQTVKRIYEYNPSMKLIYLIRNPLERIHSHYAHRQSRDKVRKDLMTEILENPGYVNHSRYYLQLSRYLDWFNKDQILVITFEEFVSRPVATLNVIAKFLGIDTEFFNEYSSLPVRNKSENELRVTGMGNTIWKNKFYKMIPYRLGKFVIHRFFTKSIKKKTDFPVVLNQIVYALIMQDLDNMEKFMGRKIVEWKFDQYLENPT